MEVSQKPNETYFLMSLKQLDELYQPIGLDIYSFLNEMLNVNSSNPIRLTENEQVIVPSIDLIKNLSLILKNYLLTPSKSHVIIDHLFFSILFDLSSHLSTNFEKAIFPLSWELQGMESLPERWEHCVKETDGAFGYGLGSLYVKAVFGEKDRQQANELIQNIRRMFEKNLDKLDWIDEQSKIEANRKLKQIKQKIGYPDFMHNKSKLNERFDLLIRLNFCIRMIYFRYIGYSMNENEYFSNGIKLLARERRRSLLKFRQQVDLTE